MDDPLLTPKEAADRLAVSAETIRAWLREGRLPGVKTGRLWRVRAADLRVSSIPSEDPADESGFSPHRSDRGATALEEPAFSEKHIHLLRSTYRAMAEQGVQRLSLRDAAAAAGVSKGIFLYYFGSKENLILSTMRWVLGRVARRIQGAVFQARSAEEKVAAMIDSIFVDPRANRNFYLVFMDLMTYAARLDRFDRLNATFRDIVNGVYAHLIAEGIQEGVFHASDAAEAAAVVRAMIDGLFLQWLEEPQWEALHPQLRELCKRAVLGYLRSGTASWAEVRPDA